MSSVLHPCRHGGTAASTSIRDVGLLTRLRACSNEFVKFFSKDAGMMHGLQPILKSMCMLVPSAGLL